MNADDLKEHERSLCMQQSGEKLTMQMISEATGAHMINEVTFISITFYTDFFNDANRIQCIYKAALEKTVQFSSNSVCAVNNTAYYEV